MAELSVNGARIEFADVGGGTPAFVFIHGWACDRSAWQPQVDDLSRDHRCVSPNLRGRGGSQAMPPFDSTQAADDVAVLIRMLSVGPAIVVGHSLGGLIALLVNDRHPDLVLGTVIADSPLTAAATGRFARSAELIRTAGSISPMAEFIEGFFGESTPELVKDHVREMMLTCPADVAAGMLENGEVFVERMGELIRQADKKPFMAIWPGSPMGNPDRLRDITMFLRQEPIPGAGHFLQLEQPELTSALLRAFLDDVERDPRIASLAERAG